MQSKVKLLSKPIAVEVLKIENVGIGLQDQKDRAAGPEKDWRGREIQEQQEELDDDQVNLNNMYLDSALAVGGNNRAADGGAQRMFKLLVTDGINQFDLMEYQHWSHIQGIDEGAKVLLKPTD